MPTMPLMEGANWLENAGGVTSTSRGSIVTANATPNTKGNYTQLIAATAFEASGILIMLDDQAAAVDLLIDIAVGAAASEVVKISNLLASGGTGSIVYGMHYFFPIKIPAGTRISARSQASTGSSQLRVSVILFGNGLGAESLGIVTPYGEDTTNSDGAQVDPGGSANTKGAYTEIIASTTYRIRFLSIAIGSQNNATRSSQSWLLDIATGAAGSEIVKVPNLVFNCSTSPDIIVPQSYNMIPVNIPAGSRLAVRAQSDGIDATDRLFDVVLYGVN